MAIHATCHEAIHFGGKIRAASGSLAARGDNGKGNSSLWKEYLKK